jgi:hypothetical protein
MTLVLGKQDQRWKILAAQNCSAEDRTSRHVASGDVASLPARWTGSDRADVKDRIEAAIAAFDEAWNRRDKTALARRFAAEADFVDTAARWLQRRELIANHIIDVEVPGFGSPTRTSGVEKVTMLYPELVVVLVPWTITDTWTHPTT